ncbi:hypothetical protein ACX93W_22865 [Paenibacillus sp. CAU 1782]
MAAEKRVYALWDDLEPFNGGNSGAIPGDWKGKKALYLNQMNSAFFLREEVTFSSFRMEAEVAIPGEVGFIGLIFGAKDESNFELVYLAPVEIQYDPIINGSMTWQIYNGPAYQKPLPDMTGAWHRFAVEVGPEGAKVFLDDQPAPAFVLSNLQHGGERLGKVGFWNYVPVYIRNFSIEEIASAEAFSDPAQAEAFDQRQPEQEEFLTEWLVKKPLTQEKAEPWIKAIAEENGTLSLNRICEAKPGLVVEAKSCFKLQEETETLLTLGYSDSIRLWVNDIEVYRGDWLWQPPSHDGRIRPDFASVPVKWRKGVNTVHAEVTQREGFGWGVAVKTGLPGITYLSEDHLKSLGHT